MNKKLKTLQILKWFSLINASIAYIVGGYLLLLGQFTIAIVALILSLWCQNTLFFIIQRIDLYKLKQLVQK